MSRINITYHRILPKERLSFPWTEEAFYDTFPESFLQIPQPINEVDSDVLAKEIRFGHIRVFRSGILTPSIPVNSFLKSEAAKKLLERYTGRYGNWMQKYVDTGTGKNEEAAN